MKRHSSVSLYGIVAACLLILSLGGCPPTTSSDTAVDTSPPAFSTLTVTKTTIPVFHNASLKAGDDLIVFGTGAVTGLGYYVPSQVAAVLNTIPGEFRSAGFAVAGKKVLAFTADEQLTVYDTTTRTATEIPKSTITLDTLPTDQGEDLVSPVVADGNLAVTRNTVSTVGRALQVVDVSGATPVVTPLNNLRDNLQLGGRQVVIDATDQVVVTFQSDSFFVYDLTKPANDPREIKLGDKDGIGGPFAYGGGYILYVSRLTALQNIRLLSLADTTETPRVFSKNPGNRDWTLAIHGTHYLYYLNRNAFDSWAESATSSDIVYRSARGAVSSLTPTEGGTPAADPDNSTTPWLGYGAKAAITPDGQYTFLAGDEDVDVHSEILQVSTTTGPNQVFADGTGYLAATDVVATNKLVAFKIGETTNTRLGYIVLP